jgi:hypothetical protein
MTPTKVEPRYDGARGALYPELAGKLFDADYARNPISLQVSRLLARFRVSEAHARALAELAYEHGRPTR